MMEFFTEGTLFAGKYKILKHIDSGGMGHVYLAEDQTLGRKIAIKVIRHSNPDQISYLKNKSVPDMHQRFLNEARALAQLDDHPHIIQIHDYGQVDHISYLVMKYFPGQAVTLWGDAQQPLLQQWLIVFRQILSALQYAHAQGVFHRDIKPSNVLVGGTATSPQVKLIDWGLSLAENRPRMTTAGLIIGTLGYSDPALIGNDEAAYMPANDLYSVGVLMYRLLCQQDAIVIDTQASIDSILNACLDNRIIPPRQHNPHIPEPLEALILQLLASDPKKRPQSAEEVSQSLLPIAQAMKGNERALEDAFDQLGHMVQTQKIDSSTHNSPVSQDAVSHHPAPPLVPVPEKQPPPDLRWLDQPEKKPLFTKRNLAISMAILIIFAGLLFAQLNTRKNVHTNTDEAKPQAVTAADLDKDPRSAPTPLEKLTNTAKSATNANGSPQNKMDSYDEKIRNRYALNGASQPVWSPQGKLDFESANSSAHKPPKNADKNEFASKGFRPTSMQQYLEKKSADKNLPVLNVKAGTHIQAKILETLDTSSDVPVRAIIKTSLMLNGQTVLPTGTLLYGRAMLRRNRAFVKFDRAVFNNGNEYQIQATAVDVDDGQEGLRGRMEYAEDADSNGSSKALEALGKIGSNVVAIAPGGDRFSQDLKETVTNEAKETYQRNATKPKKRDKMTVRNDTVIDVLFSNFKY